MTRFARAKGSKASNERVYADPTPWHEMKNEMLKKKQEIEEEKKRREAEAIRNENYKKFLKEREDEDSKKTEWADFPEDDNKPNGLSKKSKQIKKQNSQIQDKKLKKGAALLLKDGPVENIDKMSEICEIKTGLAEIKDKKLKKKKLAVVQEVHQNGTDTEKNISASELNGKKKKSKLTPKEKKKEISVDDADEDIPLEISVKVDNDVSRIESKKPKKKKLSIVENMGQTETVTEQNLSDSKLIKKNKKSKRTPEESLSQNKSIPEDDSDADMPLEVSAKVEIQNPVSNKVKPERVTTKKHYKFSEKTETGEITAEEVDTTNSNNDKEKKKQHRSLDSLPDEVRIKVEKKLERRKRQLEKKKLKKKLNAENKGKTSVKNNPIAKKIPKIAEGKKNVEPKEKLVKQKGPNEGNFNKPKKIKLENGEFKRRKDFKPDTIMVNGNEIKLEYFEGFQIKKEDAQNLRKMKEEMIIKGLPRSEINRTLKLERRKAEKALSREKKKVCFNCRKFGHNLSECPILSSKDELIDAAGSGICFKCGSTEHTSFACRVVKGQTYNFATCFICKQQGHISRQCPDNDRGLYPKGGSCRVCGDVTHLKKDCPQHQEQQRREEAKFQVENAFDDNPDDLGPRQEVPKTTQLSSKPKIIKF